MDGEWRRPWEIFICREDGVFWRTNFEGIRIYLQGSVQSFTFEPYLAASIASWDAYQLPWYCTYASRCAQVGMTRSRPTYRLPLSRNSILPTSDCPSVSEQTILLLSSLPAGVRSDKVLLSDWHCVCASGIWCLGDYLCCPCCCFTLIDGKMMSQRGKSVSAYDCWWDY